jgi:hypothetical protein
VLIPPSAFSPGVRPLVSHRACQPGLSKPSEIFFHPKSETLYSPFSGGVLQSLANRDGRRALRDTISDTICYTLDSWLLDARRSVICMVVRVKVTYGLSITLNSPSEHPDAEADEHGVCVHVKSYTVVATPARVPLWYTMFAPSTGSAAKIFVFTTWARYAPRGW